MGCLLGTFLEEDEEEEEEEEEMGMFCFPFDNELDLSCMNDICIEETNINENIEKEKDKIPALPADDSNSVYSHQSHLSEPFEYAEEIPPLTESDVLRIINDLIHGDYDENIVLLWKTVESVHYTVEDSSVCHLVFVLTLSILIFFLFLYFQSCLSKSSKVV